MRAPELQQNYDEVWQGFRRITPKNS
jgi:hypothetical protein